MKGNNGLKLFLVFALIAVMTYICFAGSLFGLVKIPGVNDIVPGIDINGGIDAMLYAVTEEGVKPTQEDLDTAKVIIGKRLDKAGILDRYLTTDVNAGRVIVQIPWAPGETDFNPDKTLDMIGETALLTFQEVDEDKLDDNGNPLPTNRKVLEGTDVVNAYPAQNPMTKGMEVVLELNDRGREAFAEATGRLIGQRIAIFMDDQFISAPVVQSHITEGNAVITLGNRDHDEAVKEAKELADTIRAGALPFKLEAKQVNAISPLLGRGALDVTIRAFIVAFLLICMFMILYYRLPGLIASIALFMLTIMTLNFVSWLGITLTLPGLAGIVLSVGMGVDANVIITERIKEELRSGKTIKTAIDLGFKRAFSAIVDGNVTTLIVAVILYFFGTGAMISFAYTLSIGVIVSFFTALTLTRTILNSVSDIDIARKTWLYGVKEV
ncbi:MAG: protein translocase subunit SecD [Acetivibrionales bacterium]|jgi:preprotein translocase subunit SecD|nr:protein translocase subunit SecD [Clostridiaceae bacterium]HOA55233.1 protein translocase subunit SecD [Clostridiales bacterium]HQD30699.1 protein translocase subunit SecD [Clostridiales bacterium]